MGLPGTSLGQYDVIAPLGAGGMGEVYRARHKTLGREVAIKLLPAHMAADPTALARFEREAQAVAALSHPNHLAIHDFGQHAPATGSGLAIGGVMVGHSVGVSHDNKWITHTETATEGDGSRR